MSGPLAQRFANDFLRLLETMRDSRLSDKKGFCGSMQILVANRLSPYEQQSGGSIR